MPLRFSRCVELEFADKPFPSWSAFFPPAFPQPHLKVFALSPRKHCSGWNNSFSYALTPFRQRRRQRRKEGKHTKSAASVHGGRRKSVSNGGRTRSCRWKTSIKICWAPSTGVCTTVNSSLFGAKHNRFCITAPSDINTRFKRRKQPSWNADLNQHELHKRDTWMKRTPESSKVTRVRSKQLKKVTINAYNWAMDSKYSYVYSRKVWFNTSLMPSRKTFWNVRSVILGNVNLAIDVGSNDQ